MADPLVSIVITCRDYRAFVGDSIDSALAQRHARTEVVVVDDGSTDGSRDVITRYGSRVVPIFKVNGGQGSAFNAGAGAARGDVVCFLDADDTLAPDAIARAVDRFREPGVVKVHWPLATVDEHGQPLGSIQPSEPLSEGDLLEAVRARGPMGYVWPVTSGNAWARGFLDRVLPIPEAEFRGAAESYLATLAPAFGRVRRITEAMGTYRMHARSMSNRRLVGEFMRATARQYGALRRAFDELGIEAQVDAWPPTLAFRDEVVRTARELEDLLPGGATFAFVEWNQWGPGEIVAGCRSVPFPERRGVYLGKPSDDAAAIEGLERFRRAGGSHVVFAWPALWWLDYYRGFRRYLEARFLRTAATARLVVFDLGRPAAA